jgi:hypothetical protein
MQTRKEHVGCVYNEKKQLTHIVHWDEPSRKPVVYKVEQLGLDEVIDVMGIEIKMGSPDPD